jgi:hypothetical protein
MALRQQGYQNEQIIQILQSQGYPSNQRFDAMNQADIGSVPGAPPQGYMQPEMQQPPEMTQTSQGQDAEPQQYSLDNREAIEEVAEAIIDEKWNELLKDINKISEWNSKTETRLTRIEQDIVNLRGSFESLQKAILGKITEYDQNLVNVGTEIKAMEKVFEKILPTFTDNVQKLTRLADSVKDKDTEPKVDKSKKRVGITQ